MLKSVKVIKVLPGGTHAECECVSDDGSSFVQVAPIAMAEFLGIPKEEPKPAPAPVPHETLVPDEDEPITRPIKGSRKKS